MARIATFSRALTVSLPAQGLCVPEAAIGTENPDRPGPMGAIEI